MDQPPRTNEVLADEVRLLYQALPFSLVATFVNAGILLAVQWSILLTDLVLIWAVLVCVLVILRAGDFYLYHRTNPPISGVQIWSRRHFLGTLIAALLWSSTPWIFFPETDLSYQTFVAFVIAGMCAGAVSSLSFVSLHVLSFLSVCLVSLSLRFLLEGGKLGLAMSGMSFLFYVLMSAIALRNHQTIHQNIALRIEAHSRQRQLAESEEKFRTIVESAPVGILHYDREGIVTSCNATVEKLLQLSRANLVGSNLHTLFNSEKLLEVLVNSLHGDKGLFKGTTRSMGSHVDVPMRLYLRGIFGDDGRVIGGVAIIEDVSDEARIERIKSEFVSTVSHELRTPLTAIHAAVGLLDGNREQLDGSKQREMIQIAKRNSDRLLVLIGDILDLDKLASGNMPFEMKQYSIMPLVEQALEQHTTYGESLGVRFDLVHREDDAIVTVDEKRFQQVMANLLSNAVKHSPTDSIVEVGVRKEGETVRIFVKDFGPGVPESFHSVLFERFTQFDASDTRHKGGAGLGLYITKEIVRRLNGKIDFDSKVGEGACFYVQLALFITAGENN